MIAREWLFRLWEKVPSYNRGRLDIRPLVVMTRARLQESSWTHTKMGAKLQRDDPGFLARAEQRDNPWPVRHLRAI